MGISKKSQLVPLLAFITMFLIVVSRVSSSIADANSLHFSFSQFSQNPKDLILQGDATTDSDGNLQLTRVSSDGSPQGSSVGRALFYAPVHIWEKSAVVASFDATFTFLIKSPDRDPADGITFFIANTDTSIPSGSGGRLLGLFPDANIIKNSTNLDFNAAYNADTIVAVELDSYPNTDIGDPSYPHIGIDIKSIRSKSTARWNMQTGKVGTAHISYNSVAKRLSAVVSYSGTSSTTVSYDVDLNNVLPEWVRVGLSATTGLYKETNTILSWSFTSKLKTNQLQDLRIASVV
uniref:Lectin n=1 Tax=Dioclea guianensis TaxID=99571 RepID=A9J248_DIOGU|nr:lectin precursor [Dioclea guianensis]